MFQESKFSTGGGHSEKEELEKKENTENETETGIDEKIKQKVSRLTYFVNERYENSQESTTPEKLEEYKNHNNQVLGFAMELGMERGLSEKQFEELAVAAVVHDLCKLDSNPSWAAGVKNFMLAYHGKAAAEELENNDRLRSYIEHAIGEEDLNERIKNIARAVECHMGPHPGFMTGILDSVNKQLQLKGMKLIEHPSPEEGDILAETLLAADMGSLASEEGVQKIMTIRSGDSYFRKQDQKLCDEYQEYGIELSLAEAAMISAFQSGKEARNMIKNEQDRDWIEKKLNKAKEAEYVYYLAEEDGTVKEIKVTFDQIKEKMDEYEKLAEETTEKEKREAA